MIIIHWATSYLERGIGCRAAERSSVGEHSGAAVISGGLLYKFIGNIICRLLWRRNTGFHLFWSLTCHHHHPPSTDDSRNILPTKLPQICWFVVLEIISHSLPLALQLKACISKRMDQLYQKAHLLCTSPTLSKLEHRLSRGDCAPIKTGTASTH